MPGVSCRSFDLLWGALDARGIPRERLIDGSPWRLAQLEDGRGRIPWDDWVVLFERFEALVGVEALPAIGRSVLEVGPYQPLGWLMSLVADAGDVYEYGLRFLNGTMFPVLETRVEVVGPAEVQVQMRIPPPYRPCPGFFQLGRGILAVYPRVLAQPDAQVDLRLDGRVAHYRVLLAEARRLRDRLQAGLRRTGRRLRGLLALEGTLEILSEEQERLRDTVRELRITRADLQRQRDLLAVKVQQLEEAREELARSEALYRSLAESAPDSILVLDRERRVRYANRVVHLDPAQLVGRPLDDLVPPEARDEATAALEQVYVHGRPARYEARYALPGAPPRWYAVQLGPIVRDGRVVGATLIARDVQEQRDAVEERLQLERRLQHAQRLESVGVLAGGIAHDFNNLLTGVLANAELLLAQVDDGVPATRRLDRIAEAARRAGALTTQMLAYAGRAPVEVRPLDAGALVEETVGLLVAGLPKGVLLHVAVDDDGAAVVEADVAQLQQVVMNLVTNAAEATGSHGQVEVRVRRVARVGALADVVGGPTERGPSVVVEVADDGPGIDPAVAERIFDPFFSTRGQGRGLGLATVVGILRRHDAALEVVPRPGGGTVFRAVFAASDRPVPRPSSSAPSPPRALEAGGTLLVVDDELLVLETARDLLQACGFEVIAAESGQEALARHARAADRIDAVVLDLSMPGMSGLEVLEVLRERGLQVPVVLCSAYDVAQEIEDLDALGVAGFVRKPYPIRRLVEVLREAMARG